MGGMGRRKMENQGLARRGDRKQREKFKNKNERLKMRKLFTKNRKGAGEIMIGCWTINEGKQTQH